MKRYFPSFVDSSKSSFRFKKEGLRKGMGAVKANPKKSSKNKIVKLFLLIFLNYIPRVRNSRNQKSLEKEPLVGRYNSAYLLYLYAYALGYSFLGKVRYGTNFSPDVLLKLDVHVFPGL